MNWIVRLRERFWAVPALLCLAGVILAEVMVTIDQHFRFDQGSFGGAFFRASASGGQNLLTAIASSLLTVTATTFSITIAVLALTSSTYGPRLIRNFMTDRGNQVVLGAFLGSFLYALLVLRSVRAGGDSAITDQFVPQLSMNVAVVLMVIDIALLVYFINHISESIQIGTLSGRLRAEFIRSATHLYPEQGVDRADLPDDAPPTPVLDESDCDRIQAKSAGYVLYVNLDKVIAVADEADAAIVLSVRPGEHVIDGDTLALAQPADALSESQRKDVEKAISVGPERTPNQDIEHALQQSSEMAIRAISPGVNDPITAQNSLDDLTAGLALMASKAPPSMQRFNEAGHLRVIAPRVDVGDLIANLFADLRAYATRAPGVMRRALQLATKVGDCAVDGAVRLQLAQEVDQLVDAYAHAQPPDAELAAFRHLAQETAAGLRGQQSDPN